MDEVRRGEIALLVLKEKVREEGVLIKKNMRRELGNSAKRIGITLEEAEEFTEGLVRDLVEEAFPPKKTADTVKTTG